METIKNYLEAMFANMPNTEAVHKAKAELLQMMEDKYNELIDEGVSENNAVGTIISEFGNLDELAEDLGLVNEVSEEHESIPRRQIFMDEAKEYVMHSAQSGFNVALGVALCILSVSGPIFADALGLAGEIGILLMFSMIAAAVFIFVYNGVVGSKWKYVEKEACQIDMMTATYLDEELNRYSSTHALRLSAGIICCVVCWLPAAVLGGMNSFFETLGVLLLFVMVAVGVFLIVYTNSIKGGYETLLKVNDKKSISGNYVEGQDIQWINDTVGTIMELFWPTVTCLYLVWSFVTFAWWKTWLIWPIAGIIYAVLKANLRKR